MRAAVRDIEMANALNVIHPYKWEGLWVFDDDIVMALALATWLPGRFNSNAKVDPRVLWSMMGQRPKPRRAP